MGISLPLVAFRDSIVVSISACHADDPGSIPGRGVFQFFIVVKIVVRSGALVAAEAVIAQLGERQTEDLEVLGSIPSPGKIFWVVDIVLAGLAGTGAICPYGALAQLVARRSHNPKVVSSILTGGIFARRIYRLTKVCIFLQCAKSWEWLQLLPWSSGYDARLTRERSPVQSREEVLQSVF